MHGKASHIRQAPGNPHHALVYPKQPCDSCCEGPNDLVPICFLIDSPTCILCRVVNAARELQKTSQWVNARVADRHAEFDALQIPIFIDWIDTVWSRYGAGPSDEVVDVIQNNWASEVFKDLIDIPQTESDHMVEHDWEALFGVAPQPASSKVPAADEGCALHNERNFAMDFHGSEDAEARRLSKAIVTNGESLDAMQRQKVELKKRMALTSKQLTKDRGAYSEILERTLRADQSDADDAMETDDE